MGAVIGLFVGLSIVGWGVVLSILTDDPEPWLPAGFFGGITIGVLSGVAANWMWMPAAAIDMIILTVCLIIGIRRYSSEESRAKRQLSKMEDQLKSEKLRLETQKELQRIQRELDSLHREEVGELLSP